MMKTRMAQRAVAILALAAACVLSAAAQAKLATQAPLATGALIVESRLDWVARTITVSLSLDMEAAGLRLPAGRLEAERLIEGELPAAIKVIALGLPVDSWRSLQDCVNDGSLAEEAILGLPEAAKAGPASFSKDMRHYNESFVLGLGEVASLLVRHEKARPLGTSLQYRPSRAYTGIVIRAKGSLPVHGEHVEASLAPCLFPRVYDDSMELILERNTVAPEAIIAWGEAGYATSLDASAMRRVGEDPLRIEAEAIFGTDRTDLIISRDDALKITALAENRALIAAGKVLFLVDEASLGSRNGAGTEEEGGE